MSAAGASALVIARAPIAGRCKKDLEPLLGAAGCARLQGALIERAVAWAATAGEPFVAHDPPEAAELIAPHAPGATLFAQDGEGLTARLAAASAHVLSERPGPLLIVTTDLPALSERHAADALEDLREGVDIVLGPALDGGFYLIGIHRPLPELFPLPQQAWSAPDVLPMLLAEAAAANLDVGLLGLERALHTPADARAVCADPLLGPELRALLRA